jgi:signal transduction histidine kinase/DNA-binding response OmpR family regulator
LNKLIYILIFFISCSAYGQDSLLKPLYAKARALAGDDPDSALHYAGILLKEAERINSLKYQVKASHLIASVYASQNKMAMAFDTYFKALKLCKKSNDIENEANLLSAVGALYYDQKSFAEAKHFFHEEIILKQRLGDSITYCNALLNISSIYRKLSQHDSAAPLLNIVRTIAFIKKDSTLLANYFNGQAIYYFGIFVTKNNLKAYGNDLKLWDKKFEFRNLRDSAELYWQKTINIWRAKNKKANQISALFNLGFVYQSKKEHNKAVKLYLAAIELAESQIQKVTLFGNLSEAYYDLKDYRNSADYFRKLLELKDSLQQNEVRIYTEKLGKQYELETNRKVLMQDMTLSLKNREIAAQQKQIYFYILIFIALLLIIIGIVFYINFNKRVTKKIEEAKEKFFTNIMHEIRTPLSMIQAPLKTLKPKLSDEESIYYINLAEKNAVRLNELINQMLDVSKIENSSYKLTAAVGTLDVFLKDIITNYEKAAAEKNISLVAEINYNGTLLVFDKDALEKIISNLLSNAIKYTAHNGNAGISVNVEDFENSSVLTVEVWDTGIGIAKNEQDKIFDRFFRSEKSYNKVKGTGIGLSLVKDLVNAYKGKISFSSEENKGTRFTVEINLKHPDQAQANSENITAAHDKPLILLIEDDKDIIDFVGNFLQSKNFEIIKAGNGNLAKLLLKNITPDLIVTDLMMDELDGLSFIKNIKSNKGLNHIPVIVLSAKSAAQTRVEVLNAGAQAFLSKPFLPEELNSVIANQLELISKIKKELKSKIETQKPDQTAEEKFISTEPYTQKLFDLIFKNLDNSDLTVELLADLMATNRSHFQRKIKSLTGFSPSELIKLIRLDKSKEFLLAKKGNITEIAYMCGFSSQSYFTKCFRQQFGFSPTQIFHQPVS